MIYDRVVKLYTLQSGTSPLTRKIPLVPSSAHYYGEMEVYYKRYWAAMHEGISIDVMIQLPERVSISSGMYAILEDGEVYRILQSQFGKDSDNLDITTLSLHREGTNYDIVRP